MTNKNAIFALAAAFCLLLFFGCAGTQACTADAKLCPDGTAVGRNPALNCQFNPCPPAQPAPPLGSDRDEHGCIGSAGYSWCGPLQQCVRPWETPCEADMVPGSDRDSHGCIASAGYTWCAAKGKCLRAWEENCTALTKSGVKIVTENFPPLNFADASGKVRGKSTAVVRGILAGMGQTGDITVMNWSDAYTLALGKEPNIALYSTAMTLDRRPLFKWVGPIGTFEEALYARAASAPNITSLDAARKAGSICVVANDVRQQMLVERGFTNLELQPSDTGCVKELAAGRADLWFGSTDSAPMVAYWAGVEEGSIKQVYVVEESEIFIAFSNSTPDATVEQWQAALDAMKASGLYDAIQGEYKAAAPDGSAAMLARMGPGRLATLISFADGKISSIEADLKAAANTDSAASGKWERIKPTLAPYAAKHGYTLFWYAKPDGSYYTVPADLASGNLGDREYFAVALSGRVSKGDIMVSKSTGRKVVVVAVPIAMGGVAGVLGGSTYLDSFSEEAAAKLALPGYMYFFALDGNGQIALHTNPERIMEHPATFGGISTTQAMETLAMTGEGEVDYEYAGRMRRAGYAVSDSIPGWRYAIAEYLD